MYVHCFPNQIIKDQRGTSFESHWNHNLGNILPDSINLGKLAMYSSSLSLVIGMNYLAISIFPFLLQILALITTIVYLLYLTNRSSE